MATATTDATGAITATVDAEGRLTLPPEFAGATVRVERVGAARPPSGADDIPDAGVVGPPFSDAKRDWFLNLLENPPGPNQALRDAAARHWGPRD